MRGTKSIVTVLVIILTALLPYLSTARTYKTTFPLTENPISEGGNWINGQTDGIDWNDCRTTSGYACGHGSAGAYKDPTALLTGSWGQDQTVEATVRTVNQNSSIYEEVELRLRSTISPNVNSGYEINFRCLKTSDAYTEIVRWNGPLGDFTYLHRNTGASCGVANGDVVKATIIGNVITVYINGVQVNQATDNTFTSGSPGIGFYLHGGDTEAYNDYGFTSLTATDELSDTETSIYHCAVGEYSLDPGSAIKRYIQIEEANKLNISQEITMAKLYETSEGIKIPLQGIANRTSILCFRIKLI